MTERMHPGRISVEGAVYFATFVTAKRRPWLDTNEARDAIRTALRTWHEEGDGTILAATLMPDHVHVLFKAGKRLTVGQCVARWKTQARKAASHQGDWQRDFWEHRVRDDESLEDYGLYLVLNPYRAGLVGPETAWLGWWCPQPERFRFTAALGAGGTPPYEWLAWDDDRFATLKTGE